MLQPKSTYNKFADEVDHFKCELAYIMLMLTTVSKTCSDIDIVRFTFLSDAAHSRKNTLKPILFQVNKNLEKIYICAGKILLNFLLVFCGRVQL